MRLVIGNRESSWSLRAWLVCRQAFDELDERVIDLFGERAADDLARWCPAGRVPVLDTGETVIWDSLAIAEYAAEQCPGLWPQDRVMRAHARSVCAEIHSGFEHLRAELPMFCTGTLPTPQLSDACRGEIGRVHALWSACRDAFGANGPWLFGHWSVADAFSAPLAIRFRGYRVSMPPVCARYADAQYEHPLLRAWLQAADEQTLERRQSPELAQTR